MRNCKNKFRNLAYHEIGVHFAKEFEQILIKGLFSEDDFSFIYKEMVSFDLAQFISSLDIIIKEINMSKLETVEEKSFKFKR